MILLDRLIHGYHWNQKFGPTRPVAVNLIQGRLRDVIHFMDKLSYGESSTPGMEEIKEIWVENSKNARKWTGMKEYIPQSS
jgi:hypothetical protein